MAPAAAMHPGLFVFDQAMGILDSSAQFRVAGKKLSVKARADRGASVTSPARDADEPGGSRRKEKETKKTKKKQYITTTPDRTEDSALSIALQRELSE